MSQPVGEVAIIGHQQQALAASIKPSDGEESFVAAKKINHAGPPFRIAIRANDSNGLIQGVIDATRHMQLLPIDSDLLHTGVHARSQLGHNLTIHIDAAVRDVGLTLATAANPSSGQNLLQAFEVRSSRVRTATAGLGRFGRMGVLARTAARHGTTSGWRAERSKDSGRNATGEPAATAKFVQRSTCSRGWLRCSAACRRREQQGGQLRAMANHTRASRFGV